MNTKYLIYLTQATESLPEEVLCLALTFKYLLSLIATSLVLIYFMPSELMARTRNSWRFSKCHLHLFCISNVRSLACSQMIAFLNAQFILSSLHFVKQSSSSLGNKCAAYCAAFVRTPLVLRARNTNERIPRMTFFL
uniref:Uncharacterized protein n=1 Tax=Glossina palpalis gambiensis TaxID=67801 RepID=A0A1B0BE88_9MUSC